MNISEDDDSSRCFPWPAGKSCAVVVTVLFDDGLDAIARAPDLEARSKSFSVWEYGARRGVDRFLGLFDELALRTSWFVPGVVAQKHAGLMRQVAHGHEVACRGVAFEDFGQLSAQEQAKILLRSRAIIEDITSRQADGFRLPQGRWPRHFDRCLVDAGFKWSASLNGDDLPYLHRSSLVEIPVHVELEDRPYFQFNFTPPFPKGLGRIASYDGVLHNWITEFDAYRRHGLCYVLQIRPEMLGTPGRIFILEDLLRHVRCHDDVWLTTAGELAAWVVGQASLPSPEHPLEVFEVYWKEGASDE
ncbi:polysaccharide deacetylase family protein [Labrys neptuniae]